jgi:hypothetical protein
MNKSAPSEGLYSKTQMRGVGVGAGRGCVAFFTCFVFRLSCFVFRVLFFDRLGAYGWLSQRGHGCALRECLNLE